MGFWKDGLSIDETKSSSLIISMLIVLIFSLVMYVLRGDITDNLLSLALMLIGIVGGYNIVHDISSVWGKNK